MKKLNHTGLACMVYLFSTLDQDGGYLAKQRHIITSLNHLTVLLYCLLTVVYIIF